MSSSKTFLQRLDSINNRVLVRNSQKLVYKKLCHMNRDQWCQKYLSVATSKLSDPKHTIKLPFSISKKVKTEESVHSKSFGFEKVERAEKVDKKMNQVVSFHNKLNIYNNRTIEEDIKNVRQARQSIWESANDLIVKHSIKMRSKKHKYSLKCSLPVKKKQQFGIEPWGNEDIEDKENKFQ